MTLKQCTICRTLKSLNMFSKDRRATDGRTSGCLACYRKQSKITYQKNLKQYRAVRRAYAKSHQKEANIRSRKHYLANRAAIIVRTTAYRKANPDVHKRAWQKWYSNNREKRRDIERRYRKLNPIRMRGHGRKRRVRMRAAWVENVDYPALLKRFGMWCYICQKSIRRRSQLHFDHVIPISRGGSHSNDNVRPAHALCNMKKHAKLGYDAFSGQKQS